MPLTWWFSFHQRAQEHVWQVAPSSWKINLPCSLLCSSTNQGRKRLVSVLIHTFWSIVLSTTTRGPKPPAQKQAQTITDSLPNFVVLKMILFSYTAPLWWMTLEAQLLFSTRKWGSFDHTTISPVFTGKVSNWHGCDADQACFVYGNKNKSHFGVDDLMFSWNLRQPTFWIVNISVL